MVFRTNIFRKLTLGAPDHRIHPRTNAVDDGRFVAINPQKIANDIYFCFWWIKKAALYSCRDLTWLISSAVWNGLSPIVFRREHLQFLRYFLNIYYSLIVWRLIEFFWHRLVIWWSSELPDSYSEVVLGFKTLLRRKNAWKDLNAPESK